MHRYFVQTVAALAFAGLCVSAPALAVPQNLGIDGVVQTSGGGPVADGVYGMTFSLLDGPKGAAVWSEPAAPITVTGGHFAYTLGGIKPVGAALTAGDRWVQVQINAEPPMPAVPLRSVWSALRAEVAEGLDCSGCISLNQIDAKVLQPYAKTADLGVFAKAADLSGYAQKAELAEFAKVNALAKVAGSGSYKDLLDKPNFADVATTGAYADLVGTPVMAKIGVACGTGLVVTGIKADGSLACVSAAVTAASLPPDGLDEISNGLLTNQFTEASASATVPIDVMDGQPAGVSDLLVVPDVGIAQSISVTIDIANSNIANLRVTLYDPTGAEFKLHDQTGSGTSLKATYTASSKLASGSLAGWVGKNAKGNWSINVADMAGVQGNKDGKILAWSVAVGVMSSKKAAATSAFQMVPQASAPVPCNKANMGTLYFDLTSKTLRYCDGTNYRNLADTCGNGILDNSEDCDDGNNVNGDGCSNICQASYGAVKTKPGLSCLHIQTQQKAAGDTAKDGNFWITAPKGQVIQVTCDMTTEGGGYTYFPVDSGKTTFKFTEDNTCKDYGLDIVMPRSKEHWTWMLAKYGNSYFSTIPGVYKTNDGGNYTGCIMRNPTSYGSGCADWRVGDGGRWWMRDSTFGEPNGDYQSNCWLSMYNFDPGNIQFNDGTCSYSTAKYLCSTNDKK